MTDVSHALVLQDVCYNLTRLFWFCLPSQVDEDVALDQAVKFCQIQLATSAQRQVDVYLLKPAFLLSGAPSCCLIYSISAIFEPWSRQIQLQM